MREPLVVFVVACALSIPSRAQVSELWTSSYNGPPSQMDFGNKVAMDAVGNVVVAGGSWNQSIGFPPPPPTQDAITLKYDANGNLLWDRRYDRLGGDDNVRGVAIDPASGAVYAAGYSSGYNGSTYVYDIVLLKYDAAGNPQWAVPYDG